MADRFQKSGNYVRVSKDFFKTAKKQNTSRWSKYWGSHDPAGGDTRYYLKKDYFQGGESWFDPDSGSEMYWDPSSGMAQEYGQGQMGGGGLGMDVPDYDAGGQNPFERQPGWSQEGEQISDRLGDIIESTNRIAGAISDKPAGGVSTEFPGSGSITAPGGDTTGPDRRSLPNGSVSDTPGDMSLVETDMPGPVDDNLTSGETLGFLGMEQSMGDQGKQYLADIAGGDIDVSELQKRVRTMQAGGGLAYGDVAARQEAGIVGRYKQGRRLQAAQQLSELTGAESEIQQKIEGLAALTEQRTTAAASSQLLAPVGLYGTLLSGSKAGQGSIFGLGRLL